MASRKITDLSLAMRPMAELFIARCREEVLDVVIICTYRDQVEQAAALASGASEKKPGQSAHNQVDSQGHPAAEAFDVGVIRNGKYIGDWHDPDYALAGEIGESIGLQWSGRWPGKLREVGHFERSGWREDK